MISIQYRDIPRFLRYGYQSLCTDEQRSNIEVPKQCFSPRDRADTLPDFVKLLETTAFWGLSSIPIGLIKFCGESPFAIWGKAIDETCPEITFAHELRSVFRIIPGKIPLVTAMEIGRTEIVKYLASNVTFGVEPAKVAVTLGRMDYLQLLRRHGHPWDETVCEAAAGKGQLDCLRYLVNKGCALDNKVLVAALLSGHRSCIEFALQKGLAWPLSIASDLAKQGNLELLQYAVDRNCLLTIDATTAAAERGHLTCLEYLLNIGCPADSTTCVQASRNGHLNCLQVLQAYNVPWDDQSTASAARNNELECLQYLHLNNCPWNASAPEAATRYGHVRCLRYLLDNGCPYSDVTVTASADGFKDPILCLRYLVEDHGVFLDTEGYVFINAFASANIEGVQYLLDVGCPYQNCTKEAGQLCAFLLESRSKVKNGRNYDLSLLRCVQLAHHYQWDMIRNNTTIIQCIHDIKKYLPLCSAYLTSEGIISWTNARLYKP